jgi:hypothetical protein
MFPETLQFVLSVSGHPCQKMLAAVQWRNDLTTDTTVNSWRLEDEGRVRIPAASSVTVAEDWRLER